MTINTETMIMVAAALVAFLALVSATERILRMFGKSDYLDAEKLKILAALAMRTVLAIRQMYGKPGEVISAEQMLNEARAMLTELVKSALPDVSEAEIFPLIVPYIEAAIAELKRLYE